MNGRIIKKLREHHGFKQVEVCFISSISQSRLSQIENGWVTSRPDELERIQAALKILTEGKHNES